MTDQNDTFDVGVIGGAGRVGLPLAMTFADCGLKTVVCDVDARRVEQNEIDRGGS